MTNVDKRAELIDAARGLGPRIRALRDQIDQDRRLPRALVDAIADAGLFHIWVPRKFGGAEVDPETYIRVVEEIARVDGSTAWCVMIGAGSAIFSGYLPEPAAQEIFAADRRAVTVGQLGASGRANKVKGGYRLSGRWSFGSGILNADWVSSGAVVYQDDKPVLSPNGFPEARQFFVPASACQVIDTWSVVGLRGTGSNDYTVNDVFVPDEYTFTFADEAVQTGPLYAFPIFSVLTCGLTSVALGIARGAIDALTELAATKIPVGSRSPLRERTLVQYQLAQAEARLRGGRAFLLQTLNEAWQELRQGRPVSLEQRVFLRLAAVHASDSAAQAVDLIYSAGGSSSLYTKNPIERAFRDVHAATQHVMVQSSQYEAVGRSLLGLEASAIPPI